MNIGNLRLSESVIVKAAQKIKLSAGQRWSNKKESFTLVKKFDRHWIIKNKYGDKAKFEQARLEQKITNEKFNLDQKNSKSSFIHEILPIAKRYFSPILTVMVLRGLKKILAENTLSNLAIAKSESNEKSLTAGEIQNQAVNVLTDVFSQMNTLSRDTLATAPNEVREKSVQITNSVRELLESLVTNLNELS